MILAVETNFILELALQQHEAKQAELILQLAEAKRIELAIPACAFLEAYGNLSIQSQKRRKLYDDLRDQINQLSRSQPFSELEQTSRSITNALATSDTQYAEELLRTVRRIQACAAIIQLSAEVITEMALLDLMFDLRPGDAFVYASVERHLRQCDHDTKIFITRDRDFESTRESLSKKGIDLVVGIGAGYGAVRQKLEKK